MLVRACRLPAGVRGSRLRSAQSVPALRAAASAMPSLAFMFLGPGSASRHPSRPRSARACRLRIRDHPGPTRPPRSRRFGPGPESSLPFSGRDLTFASVPPGLRLRPYSGSSPAIAGRCALMRVSRPSLCFVQSSRGGFRLALRAGRK